MLNFTEEAQSAASIYKTFVQRALLGEPAAWPESGPENFPQFFLTQTRNDGVQLLLESICSKKKDWTSWPLSVRETLSNTAKNDAIVDNLRQQDFAFLAQTLQKEGIEPVLLKGAALSLTHYPLSYLRTRSDTDFLISPDHFTQAKGILEKMGYRAESHMQGDYVQYQMPFSRKDFLGVPHIYDVHWKLCNPILFANKIPYEEILQNSEEKILFGTKVRVIGGMHALLHACLHRAAHHFEDQKLIWLYDIHLLLNGRDSDWREKFFYLADIKKMKAVCVPSFRSVKNIFSTKISDSWMSRFQDDPAEKAIITFLKTKPSVWSIFRWNLKSAQGWRAKIQLLRENLFPSAQFMHEKYSVSGQTFLPWLYARRFLEGLPKLFRNLKGE